MSTTAALLHLCPEFFCLEITPDDREIVLAAGSSLTLTCFGLGTVVWGFKKEDVPYFQVEQSQNGLPYGGENYEVVQGSGASNALTLMNVSWKHTGVYQCNDMLTEETKEVAVFVPGQACSHLCINPTANEPTA